MRVAIIGANGFVGRAVSRVLSKKGYYLHGFIRDAGINKLPFIDKITHVSKRMKKIKTAVVLQKFKHSFTPRVVRAVVVATVVVLSF